MRLIVVVEGQTEEAFVKDVLKPHLDERRVYTSVTIVGKLIAEKRGHRERGGGHFKNWRKDLQRILRGDPNTHLRVTTLFDLYGLPSDFPGLTDHRTEADTARRCQALETALQKDLKDSRLIPYIQRHEFEALVLASLASLRKLLDADDDLTGLTTLQNQVGSSAPEDINDGPTSAPSKRLLNHVPGFSKTLHGPLATSDTGLAALRERCPRFDAWVRQLEDLGAENKI